VNYIWHSRIEHAVSARSLLTLFTYNWILLN